MANNNNSAIATDAEMTPEKLAKKKAAEAAKQAKVDKFLAKQKAEEAKKAVAPVQKEEKKEDKKKEAVAPVAVQKFVNTTTKGQKKDTSGEMPTSYDPEAVEAAWYDWWEKEGFFQPEIVNGKANKAGTFVIPIPPPNVTGSLHLGHALTVSIQDCMIRWNRMLGKTVLYVPGTDHAGIATQVVVEKKLMKERKLSRHDLGREAFIAEVWKWKEQYAHRINNQIRCLGTSVDWTREKFTMDPDLGEAVTEAFIRLHEEKTIYRENRLVNWCTKLKTAVSNLEVENQELEGRTLLSVPDHDPKKKYEFGVIISFAYNVENSNEEIVVATTRLETMLGDTAVAVHPTDKRYLHLHGKFVIHPFDGRKIPIIADDYVDPNFGTGAVKITPAHDFNDYIVGKRNKLEFINIFNDVGSVNEFGGKFEGMQRFDARIAVLEALKAKNLYRETKDNKMVLPICTRSGNIIEPLMKPQWWVNCKDMAASAADAVRNGDLTIEPQASEKEWFRWMDNCQDWCISRQLWWGHRVPAYFVKINGHDDSEGDDHFWVSGRNEADAYEKAYKRFPKVKKQDITLSQDPDVLDTWFSSGLWPFSIMGWPKKTQDFELFYPNSLLETGWDILFFWVARMVMLGLKFTGKVPFKRVFCHAMVRDAHGRKMSKSLGNVIDPIDVIRGISLDDLQKTLDGGNLDSKEVEKAKKGQKEDFPNGIPICGTDALRFGLLAYTSAGRDINMDILRIEGYRKWCNKLWNATRFALMKLGDDYKPRNDINLTGNESLADRWILAKLNNAAIEVNKQLEAMNFMAATTAIYNFLLYELCDVYLEICKPVIDGADAKKAQASKDVLYICIDQGLKLLHPMMPFITEELYQRLPRRSLDKIKTISKTCYPVGRSEWANEKVEKDYEFVNSVIHASRSLLMSYTVKGATLYAQVGSPSAKKLLESESQIITCLVKGAKSLTVLSKTDPTPAGCALYTLTEDANIFLLVRGHVNFDDELDKLHKKVLKATENLKSWRKKS